MESSSESARSPVQTFKLKELYDKWQLKHFWGSENTEWLQDPEHGSGIRVTLQAGSLVGQKQGRKIGGAGFILPSPPTENATLKYFVKFPNDFDFIKGGKLPGLGGGNFPSGGEMKDIGNKGWSARLMWRRDGNGEAYPYIPYELNPKDSQDPHSYVQRQWSGGSKTRYGISVGRGSFQFSSDNQWHEIQEEIKLNNIGESNGELRLWYDGNIALERNDLTYRTNPKLKIDGLMFSVGHGGNDSSWSPTHDTHIDFAGFQIK